MQKALTHVSRENCANEMHNILHNLKITEIMANIFTRTARKSSNWCINNIVPKSSIIMLHFYTKPQIMCCIYWKFIQKIHFHFQFNENQTAKKISRLQKTQRLQFIFLLACSWDKFISCMIYAIELVLGRHTPFAVCTFLFPIIFFKDSFKYSLDFWYIVASFNHRLIKGRNSSTAPLNKFPFEVKYYFMKNLVIPDEKLQQCNLKIINYKRL